MKTWKISCTWEMYGTVLVEADTLEEAIKLADEGGLPPGSYVDGSFETDEEMSELLNR